MKLAHIIYDNYIIIICNSNFALNIIWEETCYLYFKIKFIQTNILFIIFLNTNFDLQVFGSLSSKYAVKDYGLTFTEKWNTDNTLATDITIQDKIAAGLKVTLEGTFAPQTG